MPTPFLTPPPGPTQLRAPKRDEGADVLGNIAGNDPNIVGQIAQLMLKMREPFGVASMGMGPGTAAIPPGARGVGHEALSMLGSLMPQARSAAPVVSRTRETNLRAAVTPDAVSQRIIPMLDAKPNVPQAPYTPRVPGAEEQQLAALRAQQQQLQEALQRRQLQIPPTGTSLVGSHSGRGGTPVREGTLLDPGAILSAEEIKALMQVMKNTTPPMLEVPVPPTPAPSRGGYRGNPRLARRPEDRPDVDTRNTGDQTRAAPGRKSNR